MIRLHKILLEQGNFKDLGPDTYQVMKDPVFGGTASSSAREIGGFNFSLDNEYKDFERITPKMQAKEWDKSISQAINRIQRVPATTDTVIDKVSKLEANIRKFKGLVGPYDDSKFRYNYLMQIVQKIKG